MKLLKKTLICILIIWAAASLLILSGFLDKYYKIGLLFSRIYFAIFIVLIIVTFIYSIFALIYHPDRKNKPKSFWISFARDVIICSLICYFLWGKNQDTIFASIGVSLFGAYIIKTFSYINKF